MAKESFSLKKLMPSSKAGMFLKGLGNILLLFIVIGLIVRILFLFNSQTATSFTMLEQLEIFGLGMINDVAMAIILNVFLWLSLIGVGERKYKFPFGYFILGFFILSWIYLTFTNTVFHEYNKSLARILKYLALYKSISFGLRLFIPSIRQKWSYISYVVLIFVYVLAMLTNAVSEYFFWDEFGLRYNFIAVDYLVYTHEVIGNILESYPIIPLLLVLITVAAVITFFMVRKDSVFFRETVSFKTKASVSIAYLVLVGGSMWLVNATKYFQNNQDVFLNELQANGIFKFYEAFKSSALDYDTFYLTLGIHDVKSFIKGRYNCEEGADSYPITYMQPEVHKNIVLITVESLSADFLAHFGNTDHLTPRLDSLIQHSLVFNNLYATGNRTVRGLEALTLSLPPSPGESIIKRPDNSNLFSVGKVLKEKGYTVQYIYGGDSYFDNMGTFFSGNGYEIIDSKDIDKKKITYQNVWGVCDEDLYTKALEVFDDNEKLNKPFFSHLMTVSNHRPFTYPSGKVSISPETKTRSGAVEYTDYAIGDFIERAKSHSWFENTIFIVVADHCASSAGKVELPLDKYHIPALIYAPGFVEPQEVNTRVSQIDIMPTVLGMLNLNYESQFYGMDIFHNVNYNPRAFIATYQDLGYWSGDILTVLSPVKRNRQFQIIQNGFMFEEIPLKTEHEESLDDAISYYQSLELKEWEE